MAKAEIIETGLVAINSVKPYKGNPRIGNVQVIRESLRKNGFYRPIVVRQETGEILAGNHTWKAAKAEGYKQIDRTLVSCDDDTAKRINLVDNKAPEHGEYDTVALMDMLGSLPDLDGTGWSTDELQALLGEAPSLDEPGAGDGEVPDDDYDAQFGVVVICEDETQQESVYHALQRIAKSETEFDGVQLKVVAV